MLFDTHAHLDDRAFDADRAELLAALPQQGLALVMNPGCSLASSRNVDKLTREYDYIYGAVGSHPDVCDEVTEEVLEQYRQLDDIFIKRTDMVPLAAGKTPDIIDDHHRMNHFSPAGTPG